MTGKMLSRRDHPMTLQTFDERDTHSRGQIGILSVGASVDDGVVRIVVHVEYRRVRNVNPERTPFERRQASLLVSERRITSCTDSHLGREDNRAAEVDRIRHEVSAACAKSGARFKIGS